MTARAALPLPALLTPPAEPDLTVVAANAAGSPSDEAAVRPPEPRRRVVTLEGVGHFPLLEQRRLFNRAPRRPDG